MSDMDTLDVLSERTLEHTQALVRVEEKLGPIERRLGRTETEQQGLRKIGNRLFVGMIAVIVVFGLAVSVWLYNLGQQQKQVRSEQVRTAQAINANNAKFCPIITLLVPRPGAPLPAGTKEQQEYALQTRALARALANDPDFRCPPRPAVTTSP